MWVNYSTIRVNYHPKPQSNNQSNNQFSNSTTNVNTLGITSKAKKEDLSPGLETVLSQVWVGNTHEAICILANSMKVLKGKTSKITRCLSCMVEAKANNNLTYGDSGQ